jgi:tetratricopeptide (TPR) repeat protein
MRDVWVAFLDDPDPAPEITMLRDQMSRHSSLMYESVVDALELKERLTERLDGWEATAGTKVPRHVDLVPSSGKEVLRAANLRLRGEKLIELGQAEAGSSALHEAATLGGPVEQLAYAKFLARHGELEGAHEWTQRAIDHFTDGTSNLYSPLAAEAFAAQAGVLRRQGRYNDAIGRFRHALTLLEENDPYAQKVRCRILDELGLAHRGVKDLESARSAFEASLQLRRAAREDVGVCQSLVNLARLEVGAGNLETARAHADRALEGLRGTPPTSLHANALLLAAQLRLRQGSPDQGIPYAEQALSLNQQMASRHGEARSLVVLAQCCREVGRKDDAARHARACLEVNKAMGSDYGVQRAEWILENLSA